MEKKYTLLCLLMLICICGFAQRISVKDVTGRTVVIPRAAKRVVLGEGRDLVTLNIVHPNPVGILAAWSGGFKKEIEYQDYRKKFPAIDKVPVVGTNAQTFSVEKAIASKPDLVIFAAKGHGPGQDSREILSQLEAAGIPVVFIDFRADPFKNTTLSISILGKLLGQSARANRFIGFYETRRKRIASRIAAARVTRPSVFMDMKAGTSENQFSSPGKGNLGDYIALAGGHNIGADVLPGPLGQLNQEYVIKSNPSIYIATGMDSFRGRGVVMGAGISVKEAQASIRKRISDPVISELDAVKNGRVFGLWHLFYASPFNILAAEAIAKWTHPALFKDIDPNASLRELNANFLSVPLHGTYWVNLTQ